MTILKCLRPVMSPLTSSTSFRNWREHCKENKTILIYFLSSSVLFCSLFTLSHERDSIRFFWILGHPHPPAGHSWSVVVKIITSAELESSDMHGFPPFLIARVIIEVVSDNATSTRFICLVRPVRYVTHVPRRFSVCTYAHGINWNYAVFESLLISK